MNASAKEGRLSSTRDRLKLAIAAAGLLLAVALLLSLTVAAPADAKAAEVIKRASVSGSTTYPAVNGEAKWKSKGGERQLEVQIEDAGKLAGKRLAVRIRGKLVGHMRVNSLGRARLEKNTEAGQSVPESVAGRAVKIRTGDGVLVASGRF